MFELHQVVPVIWDCVTQAVVVEVTPSEVTIQRTATPHGDTPITMTHYELHQKIEAANTALSRVN